MGHFFSEYTYLDSSNEIFLLMSLERSKEYYLDRILIYAEVPGSIEIHVNLPKFLNNSFF